MDSENSSDIQVTFYTSDQNYAVPDNPISLSTTSDPKQLNQIIKDLIKSCNESINVNKINFDFLINNVYLVSSIFKHMQEENIESETLSIEYLVKQPAPIPEEDIRQDDFISCVKRLGKLFLSASYDNSIHIWTIGEDEPLLVIPTSDKIKCVEWVSMDYKVDQACFISGGFDQNVQIWYWDMGDNRVTPKYVCKGHREVVLSCAVSADSKVMVSGSWDSTIKLWSTDLEETDLSEETGGIPHQTKKSDKTPVRIPRLTLGGHREAVSRVVFMSDSISSGGISGASPWQLVSCSWDHSIRLWDLNQGQEVRCINAGHAFHDVDIQGASLILSAASDNRVRIYDTRAEESLVKVGFRGHSGWLSSVAWAPHRDDQFITGSIDGLVKLWDMRNNRAPLYDLLGHEEMVTDVDWSSKDYILSSGADAAIKIYRNS